MRCYLTINHLCFIFLGRTENILSLQDGMTDLAKEAVDDSRLYEPRVKKADESFVKDWLHGTKAVLVQKKRGFSFNRRVNRHRKILS
jgi:hypothetical protein